jgi:hypothetical protein
VLSIERTHAAVVACHASPAALDALGDWPGTYACRVAGDEVLLVAPPALLPDVLRTATERVAGHDPSALVLDQTDGWCTLTLRGDEADAAYSQLSTVPLPERRPAFVQGAVAGGSAKVLALDGVLHLLVPSMLGHNLATRLNDVCRGRATVPVAETAFAGGLDSPPHQARAATAAPR